MEYPLRIIRRQETFDLAYGTPNLFGYFSQFSLHFIYFYFYYDVLGFSQRDVGRIIKISNPR